jgi:hypothetical protein
MQRSPVTAAQSPSIDKVLSGQTRMHDPHPVHFNGSMAVIIFRSTIL